MIRIRNFYCFVYRQHIWLRKWEVVVGDMIDHVGIYGARVAEGLSASNFGLVAHLATGCGINAKDPSGLDSDQWSPHSRCCENPARAKALAGFSRHLSAGFTDLNPAPRGLSLYNITVITNWIVQLNCASQPKRYVMLLRLVLLAATSSSIDAFVCLPACLSVSLSVPHISRDNILSFHRKFIKFTETILLHGSNLRFPSIFWKTHGKSGLKFGMLMYPDDLQNWLNFGDGLLIFLILPCPLHRPVPIWLAFSIEGVPQLLDT